MIPRRQTNTFIYLLASIARCDFKRKLLFKFSLISTCPPLHLLLLLLLKLLKLSQFDSTRNKQIYLLLIISKCCSSQRVKTVGQGLTIKDEKLGKFFQQLFKQQMLNCLKAICFVNQIETDGRNWPRFKLFFSIVSFFLRFERKTIVMENPEIVDQTNQIDENRRNLKAKRQKIDGSTLFSKLPLELWNKITFYLPFHTIIQLRRVSKTMLSLVNAHVASRRELELCEERPTGKYILQGADFFKSYKVDYLLIIRVFNQPNCWQSLTILHLQMERLQLPSCVVEQMVKSAPKLEELSIECGWIYNPFLSNLLSNLPKSLYRFSFHAMEGDVDTGDLLKLFKRCQNLTHLMLVFDCCTIYFDDCDDNGRKITPKRMEKLLKRKLSKLQYFFLSTIDKFAKKLESLLIPGLADNLVMASVFHMPTVPMPNLKQIAVHSFPMSGKGYRNSDRLDFWNNFPKLESMMFSYVAELNWEADDDDDDDDDEDDLWDQKFEIDTSIFSLPNCHVKNLHLESCELDDLSTLKNFNCIDFRRCKNPSEFHLKQLIKNNPSITRFSFDNICQPDLMQLIGQTMKQLSILDIYYYSGLDFSKPLSAFVVARCNALGNASITTPVNILARCK